MEESAKAPRENGPAYAQMTAGSAAAAVHLFKKPSAHVGEEEVVQRWWVLPAATGKNPSAYAPFGRALTVIRREGLTPFGRACLGLRTETVPEASAEISFAGRQRFSGIIDLLRIQGSRVIRQRSVRITRKRFEEATQVEAVHAVRLVLPAQVALLIQRLRVPARHLVRDPHALGDRLVARVGKFAVPLKGHQMKDEQGFALRERRVEGGVAMQESVRHGDEAGGEEFGLVAPARRGRAGRVRAAGGFRRGGNIGS